MTCTDITSTYGLSWTCRAVAKQKTYQNYDSLLQHVHQCLCQQDILVVLLAYICAPALVRVQGALLPQAGVSIHVYFTDC